MFWCADCRLCLDEGELKAETCCPFCGRDVSSTATRLAGASTDCEE